MKLFLILPDGVGVRNFIYSDFIKKTLAEGFEIYAWADQEILNLIREPHVLKLTLPSLPCTDSLAEVQRKAWSLGLINYQSRVFNDRSYLEYIFKRKPDSFTSLVKFLIEKYYLIFFRSEKRLLRLKSKYIERIKKSRYFKECYNQLQQIEPDFVFCSIQRSSKAIAPLLASKELNIPNACFVYSWDNLPKANLYVESDNYFVWSDLMKNDLKLYHPEVKAENIFVTGTPQFSTYFNDTLKLERETFAKNYGLPIDKKWICFSGDDITTSPFDHLYLGHLASAVNEWNKNSSEKMHIVFRPCPVDTSDRYLAVLDKYKTVITEIRPLWKTLNPSGGWSYLVAGREDISLLTNIVTHCEVVINLGSTMAHDFSVLGKPCIYINYNITDKTDWDIHKIYRFAHFKSMNDLNPVIWVNSREDWVQSLDLALYNNKSFVEDCKKWHSRIALFPLEEANDRLVKTIVSVINRGANKIKRSYNS
jgi:hypothetical protein